MQQPACLPARPPRRRFLPDKAIDLVDEAAAKLKMEITSKPEVLDEVDRKVGQDCGWAGCGGGMA